MLQTLLFALLPILVTIALGYFAAARHYFDDNDSRMLVRLVMNFMLPLSVFFLGFGAHREKSSSKIFH